MSHWRLSFDIQGEKYDSPLRAGQPPTVLDGHVVQSEDAERSYGRLCSIGFINRRFPWSQTCVGDVYASKAVTT